MTATGNHKNGPIAGFPDTPESHRAGAVNDDRNPQHFPHAFHLAYLPVYSGYSRTVSKFQKDTRRSVT
jgi:hypothetical protein